ncbi:MAG: hypothetical protein HC935_10345, partial [Pseudanabaena sp. SU_2_4]|nr:hypothetical protein [Pseudanabaena sp. SU_2_4]
SDPRYELNPAQWARGQVVRLRVANDVGTLVDAPCGWLYILAEPTDAESIGLSVIARMCLALNNFREPDNNLSGIQIGVATARHIVMADYWMPQG